LQNENSAARPFLYEHEYVAMFFVEKVVVFQEYGYSKAGPTVMAAPKLWNIRLLMN